MWGGEAALCDVTVTHIHDKCKNVSDELSETDESLCHSDKKALIFKLTFYLNTTWWNDLNSFLTKSLFTVKLAAVRIRRFYEVFRGKMFAEIRIRC